MVVGQGEAGRTIVLRVGQQLVVGLSGNPTTGFAWSYQSSADDVLRASGHEYLPAQPVLAGSGGTERFRFTAAARGHTALRFEYRRPWETGVPPAQVVEYAVVVE
jgi:inhibitor of cysteine peptidase